MTGPDALDRCWQALYPLVEGVPGQACPDDGAVALLLNTSIPRDVPLEDWVHMRLSPRQVLSPRQRGLLVLADRVFMSWLGQPTFHPDLAAVLAQTRPAFAVSALASDTWLLNAGHPAREFSSLLFDFAKGWQPELGPSAGAALDRLRQQQSALVHGKQDWHTACTRLRAWLEEEAVRRSRVEERLAASEAGSLREHRARQLAARTFNQSLAARVVSAELADILFEAWYPAMQWVLLREGEKSLLWMRVKRTLASLLWTVQPDAAEPAQRQKFLRVMSEVRRDVEDLAQQLLQDAGLREQLLAVIDDQHLRILQGKKLQPAVFTPLELQDPLAHASLNVSATLMEQVRALTPGQWVLLHEGAMQRRARLLLRNDDIEQLLFVNMLGVKVLHASWDAFACRLAAGDAEILPAASPLDEILRDELEALEVRAHAEQNARLNAVRLARERAAAEAQARELARQKAVAEARALADAREEAKRRADQLQDAEMAGKLQRARLLISSLTIGAWMEFRQADGSARRVRLAVILPSNGKYIFADRDGTGRLETTRDELMQAIAAERAVPVNQDARMADTLARVADSVRQGGRGTKP